MSLNDAEHTRSRDQLRAVGSRQRPALLGWHLIGALLLGSARAQSADLVRNLPDAVLVRHQNMIVTPGEPVWLVEVLNVASPHVRSHPRHATM